MASTVQTFAWKAMYLEAHDSNGRNYTSGLDSPTFGNEKVKFYLYASACEDKSKAKFFLCYDSCSAMDKIVADIEYRTSKNEKFEGEFTCLKNQEMKKGSEIELTTVNLIFEEKPIPHYSCDGHFVHIEVKITYLDEEVPSFLNTWNSPGCPIKSLNHAEILSQNLDAFGADSSYADVTICTVPDDKEFKVHSTILAMRSPVFAAMFSEGNFKESQEKKVYIDDFDGQIMAAFIDYLYGRKNTEWKSFAGELAKIADKYDVQPLFSACGISLGADLNVEIAPKSFNYAYQLGMADSMREIAQYIFKNKAAVMATDGWKEYFQSSTKMLLILYTAT